MKPLSEKLKELSGNVAAHGCDVCGECHVEETFTRELQAWLREVESFIAGEICEAGSGYGYEDGYNDAMNGIRQKLLGTTRTEGEK
ncbi:hypothetical protein LCGC14_0892040 [marine sediment metagenome]|uniref:Uncharacterized protein n=1 Tax=marine sediment metagenome TaxID=412755 RepID=A0A0F9RI50_9ZZZZ